MAELPVRTTTNALHATKNGDNYYRTKVALVILMQYCNQ